MGKESSQESEEKLRLSVQPGTQDFRLSAGCQQRVSALTRFMVDMPGMCEGGIKIRRGKRTDFPALMALLAVESPGEASKGQMRHWRRLASDPGLDFYVAEQRGTIQGMVLVCYIRDLRCPGWQAILDVVVPASGEYGIAQALLAFAKMRARKRGCQRLLVCEIESKGNGREVSLGSAGFRPIGEVLSCEIA